MFRKNSAPARGILAFASALFFPGFLCGVPDGRSEGQFFRITVVDEETGRGVPLVELRTVNGLVHYTDSNGIVAFSEPGLMSGDVFFYVRSHGYEFAEDGFGFRGRKLRVRPGGSETLKIRRRNIAERLYRVTGSGTYVDSIRAGVPVPSDQPLINAKVLGSDSVLSAVYRGKVYWIWGDTNRAEYPLGNFHASCAVSLLPEDGGLDPGEGVALKYFTDENGFAKGIAPMPGKGPTWLHGLTALEDDAGRERLAASYVKIEPPMTIYRRGLAVFKDEEETFEPVLTLDESAPVFPNGHPFRKTEGGVEYIYYTQGPYPFLRVPASFESWKDPAQYEAFTCLREGRGQDELALDRDGSGRLVYGWKRNTPIVDLKMQVDLVKRGLMEESEGWIGMRSREDGRAITAHDGSVYWNDYRRRWIMIFVEAGGESSYLGEVWLAEAEQPEGPWMDAVKIATHENYSFYNPKHHPFFDQDGGRVIYFEGTYTTTFAKDATPTPRYDYNQVMYRLDLADERLKRP